MNPDVVNIDETTSIGEYVTRLYHAVNALLDYLEPIMLTATFIDETLDQKLAALMDNLREYEGCVINDIAFRKRCYPLFQKADVIMGYEPRTRY